jgi:hypothetical protein
VTVQDGNIQLQSQILELEEQIKAFNLTSENADAIAGYRAILPQLSHLPELLEANITEALIMRHADLKGPLLNELTDTEKAYFETTEQRFVSFVDHWEKEGYNARQGSSLENFKDAVNALIGSIKQTNVEIWAEWTDSLRANFAVEEYLLDAQRGIDTVEQRRDEFKSKRSVFYEKSKRIPDDMVMIEDIRSLAKSLVGLLDQMDHDVPEDVKQFFDSISGPYGAAPISLLTPEVFEYLRENKALDNFVVQRPGHRRGY